MMFCAKTIVGVSMEACCHACGEWDGGTGVRQQDRRSGASSNPVTLADIDGVNERSGACAAAPAWPWQSVASSEPSWSRLRRRRTGHGARATRPRRYP